MLEVLRVQEKQDKNGKQYKTILFLWKNKTAFSNIYKLDYLQRSNDLYDLDEGDTTEGEIVTLKIKPILTETEIISEANVCLFSEEYDPIQREINIIEAFDEAGYKIEVGQLKFGEQEELPEDNTVPENCLIVNNQKQ